MYIPNVLSISAPFVNRPLLDIPNKHVPCTPVPLVANLVMWAPIAQLQPQLALPLFLPEWAILEDFESESQGYEGGNVTVEEAPISFSPFSPVDCLLISHFSFNNFITLLFLD